MLFLKAHHQTQVAALHLPLLIARQGGVDRLFEAALEHIKVPLASHPVEDGTGHSQFGIELDKSLLYGRCAAGHAVHIDDQENRNIQDPGHLGGAAHIPPVHAVK